MEKLIQFVNENLGSDTSRLILDRAKYPDIDMDLAVNCIESRRKLKGKVQEWYDTPGLVFPLKLSAEQCSSSATGRYKAELAEIIIGKKSEWTLADLTGGLGVDSWFFSQKASKVAYFEMKEALCHAAKHNFRMLNAENITVNNLEISKESCAALETVRPDIIYMDPARRGEGGKKVFLIEECTPDVLGLRDELFKYAGHLLIKLSPMADISMVCERLGSTCREVHVVAAGGECKELLIWMDKTWQGEYSTVAIELHNDSISSAFRFWSSEESGANWQDSGVDMPPPARGRERLGKWSSGPLQRAASIDRAGVNGATCQFAAYIFEPGKAMMKSGCFNLIASRFAISKLGKSTHYYVTDSAEKAQTLKMYGKVFQIMDVLPLDKRSIKEIGKKYPKAEVTARNIPMDTETLRKKLGVTSGDDAHIFGLKSDTEGNLLIAAQRE